METTTTQSLRSLIDRAPIRPHAPDFRSLALEDVAQRTRASVRSNSQTVATESALQGIRDQEEARVRAATPVPNAEAVNDLRRNVRAMIEALAGGGQKEIERALEGLEKATPEAKLYRPNGLWMPLLLLIGQVLGIVAVTVIAVSVSTALLAPSMDGLTRGYLVSLLGGGNKLFAAQMGWFVAFLAACGVFIPLPVAVVATGGRINLTTKIIYVVGVELLFSVAFSAIRFSGTELSWAVISWSLLELAVALAHGIVVTTTSGAMAKSSAVVAHALRPSPLARAQRRLRQAEDAFALLLRRLEPLVQELERAMYQEAQLEANLQLVRTTVDRAFYEAMAELQNEVAVEEQDHELPDQEAVNA